MYRTLQWYCTYSMISYIRVCICLRQLMCKNPYTYIDDLHVRYIYTYSYIYTIDAIGHAPAGHDCTASYHALFDHHDVTSPRTITHPRRLFTLDPPRSHQALSSFYTSHLNARQVQVMGDLFKDVPEFVEVRPRVPDRSSCPSFLRSPLDLPRFGPSFSRVPFSPRSTLAKL